MGSDCESGLGAGAGRIDAMRRRAAAEGLPLHATFALTHRCNFRCVHCYVRPGERTGERELSAAEWLAMAREAAEAGCFSVLLTGGEPLLRRDFAEIYLGIRRLGIHAMLFTNAALVDERTVAALRGAPPRLIEATVYGATPETYAAVTGNAGAFEAARRGIALLREAKLPVRLKTVLMKPTRHEFEAIRGLAADGEPAVRYDAAIQPRYPGDPLAAELRVPPAEVAELEARTIPELPVQWRRQRERQARHAPDDARRLYACAAGGISFYVSADGFMQPCVSAVRYRRAYEPGKLLETFRAMRAEVQAARAPADYACATCSDRVFCGSCPPVAELDSGSQTGVFRYACELARERAMRSLR
jgi:MoaA/NifB/PqqE/SkfB family radical SAM enzyme